MVGDTCVLQGLRATDTEVSSSQGWIWRLEHRTSVACDEINSVLLANDTTKVDVDKLKSPLHDLFEKFGLEMYYITVTD